MDDNDPSCNFKEIIEFVCEKFPEACGCSLQGPASLFAGMRQQEVAVPASQFRWVEPIGTIKSQMEEELRNANKVVKDFSKLPASKRFRAYKTMVGSESGRSPVVNPELVPHLLGQSEPRVSLTLAGMMRLESGLSRVLDSQQFSVLAD